MLSHLVSWSGCDLCTLSPISCDRCSLAAPLAPPSHLALISTDGVCVKLCRGLYFTTRTSCSVSTGLPRRQRKGKLWASLLISHTSSYSRNAHQSTAVSAIWHLEVNFNPHLHNGPVWLCAEEQWSLIFSTEASLWAAFCELHAEQKLASRNTCGSQWFFFFFTSIQIDWLPAPQAPAKVRHPGPQAPAKVRHQGFFVFCFLLVFKFRKCPGKHHAFCTLKKADL